MSEDNHLPENNYPHLCREVGLSCEECTRAAAQHMSRLCMGLRGKAVGQLFVQLYTHPACAPMHTHFAAAYQEAAQQEASRKGPGRVLAQISAAVA
jgi:hypothetical protein